MLPTSQLLWCKPGACDLAKAIRWWSLPCGVEFRYAAVVPGNYGNPDSRCAFHSSEDEFDAVMHTNVLGAMRVLPQVVDAVAPRPRWVVAMPMAVTMAVPMPLVAMRMIVPGGHEISSNSKRCTNAAVQQESSAANVGIIQRRVSISLPGCSIVTWRRANL